MKERKVVFKMYVQNQPMLIPPSYEDLVPLNHPVRVVNEVIERIDIGALEASYKGGGTSSYHPRMLLKVLVYAYLRDTYSSRKIEQALKENVHFMWLAGGAKPDRGYDQRLSWEASAGAFEEDIQSGGGAARRTGRAQFARVDAGRARRSRPMRTGTRLCGAKR